jgi:hypothetical protein
MYVLELSGIESYAGAVVWLASLPMAATASNPVRRGASAVAAVAAILAVTRAGRGGD